MSKLLQAPKLEELDELLSVETDSQEPFVAPCASDRSQVFTPKAL